MEQNEMLEHTNETENVETLTTEENVEGIELTDTSEAIAEEKESVKSLRELLREHPEYQEEFNGMVKTRLDRKDREYQKELSKYKDTESVLRTTMNISEDDDVNAKLREYYNNEGVKLPEPYTPGLSTREIQALANVDAEEIMEEGTAAMEDEANRLARIGYANLNEREKLVFNKLAETLTNNKNREELLKLGATEEILKDSEFNSFRSKFANSTPIGEIYSLYKTTQPKTKAENPGSMKNVTSEKAIKDYYSPEEVRNLTDKELNNPDIMRAVEASMTRWYKENIQ